jgi:hypothetical protein
MRYRQGREMKWESPEGDGYGGADMGSLAHWLLSRWDMELASLDAYRDPRYPPGLPAYLRHVYSSAANRKILIEWLSRLAESGEGAQLRRLRALGSLRNETAFSVTHRGSRLVGSIDVHWEDGLGLHIRDWKITREQSAPDELYEEQLDFYALAAHLTAPQKSIDVSVIYLRPNDLGGARSHVRPVTRWDDIGEKIASAANAAISGPFGPRRGGCGECPFRTFCNDDDAAGAS